MNILEEEHNLESYLLSFKNRNITIVSAFASKTEDLAKSLIAKNKSLHLIIGTINAFSSPKFIEYCSQLTYNNKTNQRFSFYVDFGYSKSIHWKIYLISPNITVIGSANFTNIGIQLKRDTCVAIEDKGLYESYISKVDNLTNRQKLITPNNRLFKKEFENYVLLHRRNQSAMAGIKRYSSVRDWLNDETNQGLPVFIWGRTHTKEEKKIFGDLLGSTTPHYTMEDVRDHFSYTSSIEEMPYKIGDVVLCSRSDGEHLGFFVFDHIVSKNGINYIYSYKRKTYHRPFNISEIKPSLKESIPSLFDEGVTFIDRYKIEELLYSSRCVMSKG